MCFNHLDRSLYAYFTLICKILLSGNDSLRHYPTVPETDEEFDN